MLLNEANNYILNFPLFVHFVNKYNISVTWTIHDCKTLIGKYSYSSKEFKYMHWNNGCGHYPLTKQYETSWLDNSSIQWHLRNKNIYRLKQFLVINPSQ